MSRFLKYAFETVQYWPVNRDVLMVRFCCTYLCKLHTLQLFDYWLMCTVAFSELIHQSKSGRNTPGHSGSRSGSLSHKSYSFEDIAEEEETGKLVVKEPSKPK